MNKYGWMLAAALCGALVGLKAEKKAQSGVQKLLYVLCGMAFSFFITPLITAFFKLNEPGELTAIGFALAMLWLNIYNRFARGIAEARLPFDPKPESVEVIDSLMEAEKEMKK